MTTLGIKDSFFQTNNTMEGYIGECEVDISTHPIYSKYTVTDWIMEFIERYGQIDGAHHKTWVLDQVARIAQGTPIQLSVAKWKGGHTEYRINTGKPSPTYVAWVVEMKGSLDDEGESEYEYDEGIPP